MSVAARTIRPALRQARACRAAPFHARRPAGIAARFESTASPASNAPAQSHGRSGAIGGIAGGAFVFLLGYLWYRTSGVSTVVDAGRNAEQYIKSVKDQLKGSTNIKPDETLEWFRTTASSYAAFVPGGKQLVDSTFREIESIKAERGQDLNKLISDAYAEIKELMDKGGLDIATAKKAGDVLTKYMGRISDLATDVSKDVLEKHPELKEKYGSKLQQLKEMGEKQGGDAKKFADDTWSQLSDAMKKGSFDKGSIDKIIQDGLDKAQGISNEVWQKAMDTAKPYLDKAPEVQKMIEQNADELKKADFGPLVKKLQEAASSGNMQPLKEYLDEQIEKIHGMSDQAWRGGMARASIYLDKHPDIKQLVEERGDVLKRVNMDELMDKIRESAKAGDMKPVKDYVESQVDKFKKDR